MTTSKPASIDEYISGFPEEAQKRMRQIRSLIKEIVPESGEKISYGMPTFTLNNTYLVYFAAYKNHIGLYPAPVGNDAFKEELSHYKTGKGSVQFPLNQPMPMDLIEKIVKFRVKESLAKAGKRK